MVRDWFCPFREVRSSSSLPGLKSSWIEAVRPGAPDSREPFSASSEMEWSIEDTSSVFTSSSTGGETEESGSAITVSCESASQILPLQFQERVATDVAGAREEGFMSRGFASSVSSCGTTEEG